MNKFLSYIKEFINAIADAKQAAALSKLHKYDEARNIMTNKK